MTGGRVEKWLFPLFLLLCLLLGGSSQGVIANLLLRWMAIGVMAWALVSATSRSAPTAARMPMLLLALLGLLVVAQLVPLPPALWKPLPGRGFVADGFALLGQPLPWMSWSLAPYDTFASGLALLVPAAMFVGLVRRPALPRAALIAATIAATLAGCLLGILQLGGDSGWYLYRFSAFNTPAGFFANSNHMATLLLVSLPLLAAVAAEAIDATSDRRRRAATMFTAVAVSAVLMLAIFLNGSFAILLLGGPVALATAAMLARGGAARKRWAMVAALVVVVASAAALLAGSAISAKSQEDSVHTRSVMWETSARAIGEFGVAGAGIGSFPSAYPRFEDPAAVTNTYVNHAHNDYLEVAFEGGLPGVLLILALLWWWARASWRIWRNRSVGLVARAATIASATILLHSMVDYPLRTPAIAALFAMCLAFMVRPASVPVVSEPNQLRPTRHRVIG